MRTTSTATKTRSVWRPGQDTTASVKQGTVATGTFASDGKAKVGNWELTAVHYINAASGRGVWRFPMTQATQQHAVPSYAWRNNYSPSWCYVIGCTSSASWILMLAKTRKTFILVYFISANFGVKLMLKWLFILHLFYFVLNVRTA